MEEEAVVDEVMQRVREKNYAERMKRREELYDKHRKNLAENKLKYSREFKEEEIISTAQSLASHSSDKEKALSDLKNSFIQDERHIIIFMKVEGALHSLVGLLMSQNPVHQLLAAECVCNLALGDSKSCFKLAKFSGPYLVNILQGCNHNLMNVVLQTINNLSGSGKKTCQLLYSQGILQSLLHTMSIPEVREKSATALTMFTKIGSAYMTENDVQSIVNCIIPYFEESSKVQWLLYLLSSLPHVTPLLLQHDMPERIFCHLSSVSHLGKDNMISVTSLVRLFGNLSGDPDGITANLILDNWEQTLEIVRFFYESKYRHLCKEMFWSLGNTFQHESAEVKEKVKSRTQGDLSWLRFCGSAPAPEDQEDP